MYIICKAKGHLQASVHNYSPVCPHTIISINIITTTGLKLKACSCNDIDANDSVSHTIISINIITTTGLKLTLLLRPVNMATLNTGTGSDTDNQIIYNYVSLLLLLVFQFARLKKM